MLHIIYIFFFFLSFIHESVLLILFKWGGGGQLHATLMMEVKRQK